MGRRSSLPRLRRGGWGIFRRRTWECRLCSFGPEGSGKIVSAVIEWEQRGGGELALPLRSRKKTADAIAGGDWGLEADGSVELAVNEYLQTGHCS